MPYIPKFRHLFKILFNRQDPKAAEALWYQGSLLHDEGDEQGALMAFRHACLLDKNFGGAHWNYAAIIEKRRGASQETLDAWREYIRAAQSDPRQARESVDKVRRHVDDLANRLSS